MGHDIDLIDTKTGVNHGHTYITGNFTKYGNQYPGIYAIHGHSNETVIKVLKTSLIKLLNDDIVPYVHKPGGRALTFGVPDNKKKDLECYAACLQEFLQVALNFKEDYPDTHQNIHWYSDQVWEIKKYIVAIDGYDSEGEKYENDSGPESDDSE